MTSYLEFLSKDLVVNSNLLLILSKIDSLNIFYFLFNHHLVQQSRLKLVSNLSHTRTNTTQTHTLLLYNLHTYSSHFFRVFLFFITDCRENNYIIINKVECKQKLPRYLLLSRCKINIYRMFGTLNIQRLNIS